MTIDLALFLALAVLAVITAAMTIASPNAVYSALYLVLNFATIAVLFLLLNAAFIAFVQIAVYAGAIMVLFLFVIMLLGAERVETRPSLPFQLPLAVTVTLSLAVVLSYALLTGQVAAGEGAAALAEGFGSPRSVGELLFSRYLVPFEVTSVLLLVAVVGAVILAREEKRS